MPLKQIHDLSTQLSVQHSVGEDASPVSPLITYRAVMSAVFFCHYLVVVLLWFWVSWNLALRCYNSLVSCFFSTAKSSLKAPLHCRAGVWGEIWREGWVFFWVVFILRLWWKTIICVPWAIFPCWPASERSVFDMPVVLEKKGRTAGVWVLFSI